MQDTFEKHQQNFLLKVIEKLFENRNQNTPLRRVFC